MPKLTINISGIGSPLSDGGSSLTGHMWYSITDANGNTSSYGFAPAESGQAEGPGEVKYDDSSHYLVKEYTQDIEITDYQYNTLKDYGTDPNPYGFDTWYNGLSNSCVDFTWKALQLIGLNPNKFEGDLLPVNNIDDLKKLLGPGFGGNTEWSKELNERLLEELKKAFEKAEGARSPIVLDLDGDGVETIGLSEGIHFDHDSNGFAELTGWVAKDDGLLVWDRNGNGVIDSGAELFGNNTSLVSGEKAENGFLALASLDVNGDGVVDVNDAMFGELKVWVDKNTDGISQADEVSSLLDAGIISLNTAYTEPGKLDANGDVPLSVVDEHGNQHRQVGSYTKIDGVIAVAEDVWFAVDGANTIDLNTVAITAEIARLPDLEGFGNVHRLHQAMALDSSGQLQDLIARFSSEIDTDVRRQLMTNIIYHWAGVEDIDPESRAATQIYGNVIGDARKLAALEAFLGEDYLGTWCWGERDPNPHGAAAPILLQAFDNLAGVMYSKLMLQTHLYPLWSGVHITASEKGIVWDTSEIVTSLRASYAADEAKGMDLMKEFATSLEGGGGFGEDLLQQLRSAGNAEGTAFDLSLSRMGLLTSVGDSQNDVLYGSERTDSLIGMAGNDTLYGNGGDDRLVGGAGNDYLVGGEGADTYEFGRGDGKDTILNADIDEVDTKLDRLVFEGGIDVLDVRVERNYYDLLLTLISTGDSVTIQSYFDEDSLANHGYTMDEIVFGDGTVWTMEQIHKAVTVITEGNDKVWGSFANDSIDGGSGDDSVYGLVGNDELEGNTGNDFLDGGTGNDKVYGGEGDDILLGGDGDDYLEGGAGGDRLLGGSGANTYFYGRGQGDDVIVSVGKGDRILLGAGIEKEQIRFSRGRHSLFITDLVSGQKLEVEYLFDHDNRLTSDISVSLNDGSVISISEIVLRSMLSTSDSDSIVGYITDDVIWAGDGNDFVGSGDGNDVVYGEAGNDEIYGEAGNDYLYGGEGDDWLNGGSGEDVFDGGSGNDTLIFGGSDNLDVVVFRPGSGHDVVDYGGFEFVTIKLDSYSSSDVVLTRNNYDLVLTFPSGSDTLTLKYAFDVDVARYGFAIKDAASVVVYEQVSLFSQFPYAVTVNGTEDSDSISSGSASDHLVGYGGDDYLYAAEGDDLIEGGLGNDYLAGGAGNDTYIYRDGDGADRIDSGWGGIDTLVIESAIDSSRITFHRADMDLVVRIDGNKEQSITISGYYYSGNPTVSKVFYAGVEHTIQQIADLAIADPVNDMNQGTFGSDVLLGGLGDDMLYGVQGDDLLYGGRGNDTYIYTGVGAVVVDDVDGKSDTLAFYSGATIEQVLSGASRKEGDLIIDAFKDGSNTVTVKGFFDRNTVDVFAVHTGESVSSQYLAEYMGQTLSNSTISLPDSSSGGSYLEMSGVGRNIVGSYYDDHLVAGDGDDTLQGRGGNDFLKGGSGADTYVFGMYDGHDVIDNSQNRINDFDVLSISGVRYYNLWFSKSFENLVVDFIDTDDGVTINNWFSEPDNQLDLISAGNYAIDAASVNLLVDAMASFGPADGGAVMKSLTLNQQYEVQGVMAANWYSTGSSGGGVPT